MRDKVKEKRRKIKQKNSKMESSKENEKPIQNTLKDQLDNPKAKEEEKILNLLRKYEKYLQESTDNEKSH